MGNLTRKTVLNNLLWRFFERIGAQGVAFIVSIVLARILEPSVYGMIALVMVFTTLLQVFVDSGLGSALIQKKNADDLDFSTVFYFNLFICLVLYSIMFIASPWIAAFYRMPELTSVIRVLSITLLISGVKNIQQSYVSRNLMFKKFFFATLGGTIGAGILGIVLAYKGFGVWALVVQHLFNATVDTVILWITVKWRPKRMFSIQRLRRLFSYGWKMLVSALLDTGYREIQQLTIGKLYTSSDLAFFNRGQQFPNVIVTNVNSSIDSVLFPTLSSQQDDRQRLKMMTRRAIKTSTYIMAPLMIGMAACSETIVRLILTEKWFPCVPFMIIYCITYMFYPIHTANLNAIKALGKSDLFLKLEILKKIVGLAALLITMKISVMAMAYSLLFTSLASQIINSWPNRKLLEYGYWQQLKDILPGILLAIIMGCCIYPIHWIRINDLAALAIEIILGMSIYLLLSYFFKLESFYYVLLLIRPYIKRKSDK